MESLLLSAKLQDCYNATATTGEDELNIYCPVIGQACVALYDDKLWYRAQVIGQCPYIVVFHICEQNEDSCLYIFKKIKFVLCALIWLKGLILQTNPGMCLWHVCVGHPGGRKVEVRYVDFGNNKILSVSDLRKIKNEFFALPSMVRTYLFDQMVFIGFLMNTLT